MTLLQALGNTKEWVGVGVDWFLGRQMILVKMMMMMMMMMMSLFSFI